MESRQKIVCGIGSIALLGLAFGSGVWFGKRSNTFVLKKFEKKQSETTSNPNVENNESLT